MNPVTGRFEVLQRRHEKEAVSRRLGLTDRSELVRPNGSPVPAHWAIFTAGELVAIKGHTFKVAYINEATLILEPVKLEEAVAGVAAASP